MLFEVRHRVVDLDRSPFVNTHLLHHTVEEVFSFLVRAGGEDLIELVDETDEQFAVTWGSVKARYR
jgi:hypothetical protein